MSAGKSPAEAAKAEGVVRQTAYTRQARLNESRIEALRAMHVGRTVQLDAGQLEGLHAALLQRALAHGFDTEQGPSSACSSNDGTASPSARCMSGCC